MSMFSKTLVFFALFAVATLATVAQPPEISAPRESKLLNGTRVLVWNDPSATKVAVKIRIHSGAAFDPAGKEGLTQLVADNLFPNETTREFFTDDLGGSFEVVVNYDYIQINTTADTDKLLTVMETISAAVTSPQINKETTARLKAALTARVANLENDPVYVAERLAAKRLFGNYPYGRPMLGTTESIAKIDFADLLQADQRFFTADNATVAITGNVAPEFAHRAAKRLFGGWLKADKKVPATFAQPAAADPKPLRVEVTEAMKTYSSAIKTAAARNDKDFWATALLSRVWEQRYCFNQPSTGQSLSYSANLLKGFYILNRVQSQPTGEIPVTNGPCSAFAPAADGKPVGGIVDASEFATVKDSQLAKIRTQIASKSGLADLWFDVETYKLVSVKDEFQRLEAVTVADLNRIESAIMSQQGVSVIITGPTPAAKN